MNQKPNTQNPTLKNLKLKEICNKDNINQSKIMCNEISKKEYEYNKRIIHELYNSVDSYSINQIIKILDNKTINL